MNLLKNIKQILTLIFGKPKIPFWKPVWIWEDKWSEEPVLGVIVPRNGSVAAWYYIKELSADYAQGLFTGWSFETHPGPMLELYAWEEVKPPTVRRRNLATLALLQPTTDALQERKAAAVPSRKGA